MKRWPPKCNVGYPRDPAAPAKSSFTSFVGEVIVHVLKECYKTWPTVEMRRRSDESKELALLMAAGGEGHVLHMKEYIASACDSPISR